MKTVMLLVNGFGVEAKNSYEIYNKDLMPNLDMLTQKYLFSKIETNANNYQEGYQNMCLEIADLYNYSLFDHAQEKGLIINSPTFKDLQKEFTERKSKLHLLVFIDKSLKIVEQLKTTIKTLNPNKDRKVFLHIVLTSNNIEDYKRILNVLSKINVELSDYAKIGLVIGLANLSNSLPVTEFNFLMKILISEIAEKWQSFTQKLDVCYGIKQIPNQVKPFVVNSGFSLDKDDLFMIWNYDKADLTVFINNLKQIRYGEEPNNYKLYSLFSVISKESIPNILKYEKASNNLVSNIEKYDSKSLIIAKRYKINIINYYANGLQSVINERLTYVDADNYLYKPKELLNLINNVEHNLIIINYDIDNANSIEELQGVLHNIDIMVGNIYENSKGSKYSMIISSLFGTNKVLKNVKGEICNIVFGEKLPIVFIDDFITKTNYLIEDGDISNLLPVCYMRLSDKFKGHAIVTKKNALYRLIFK